jgi:hypothetical protein
MLIEELNPPFLGSRRGIWNNFDMDELTSDFCGNRLDLALVK